MAAIREPAAAPGRLAEHHKWTHVYDFHHERALLLVALVPRLPAGFDDSVVIGMSI